MKHVALLCSCPLLRHTFDALGPHLGKTGDVHRFTHKCGEATDQVALAAYVREKVAGSSVAVVGIHAVQHEETMRTLLTVSRSRQCAVVMTLEGYRGFVDFAETMSDVDRGFLCSRIIALVLVGDTQECFVKVPDLLPSGLRVRHIGGITWSPDICASMAAFIRGDAAQVA